MTGQINFCSTGYADDTTLMADWKGKRQDPLEKVESEKKGLTLNCKKAEIYFCG